MDVLIFKLSMRCHGMNVTNMRSCRQVGRTWKGAVDQFLDGELMMVDLDAELSERFDETELFDWPEYRQDRYTASLIGFISQYCRRVSYLLLNQWSVQASLVHQLQCVTHNLRILELHTQRGSWLHANTFPVWIQTWSALQILELNFASEPANLNEWLDAIITSCCNLQHGGFEFDFWVPDRHVPVKHSRSYVRLLSALLRASSLRSLRLVIEFPDMVAVQIQTILPLRYLHLGSANTDDSNVQALVFRMLPSLGQLLQLYLEGIEITNDIIDSIASNCMRLRCLWLEPFDVDFRYLQATLEQIEANGSLKWLSQLQDLGLKKSFMQSVALTADWHRLQAEVTRARPALTVFSLIKETEFRRGWVFESVCHELIQF